MRATASQLRPAAYTAPGNPGLGRELTIIASGVASRPVVISLAPKKARGGRRGDNATGVGRPEGNRVRGGALRRFPWPGTSGCQAGRREGAPLWAHGTQTRTNDGNRDRAFQ